MIRANPKSARNHSASPPWRLFGTLGLVALALILFGPALHFPFIDLDDPQYVSQNPHINTGFSFANLRWAFTTVEEQWWLPLLRISYMLDTELFGPGPFGYHLTNILLHALNAALLFWVLSRLTKTFWPAAFIAALFAVHPLRVEAVAWITARKDVLSGLFFMLALLAHLRFVERPTPIRRWLVAALMLCGLLSKGILVILPPILLLLDYWPLQRAGDPFERREWPAWGRLLLEKWPLILLAAVFTVINWHTHASGSGAIYNVPLTTRLGLIPPNYWAYLAKFFWPHPLALVYPERDVVVWGITTLALTGLIVITAAGFLLRRRYPALLVGWLWFLIGLLPVIRGVRLGIASMTNRFSYLPSIGLAILLTWAALESLPRRRWRPPLLTFLALLILLACFLLSRRYLACWRNSETLFRHSINAAPRNYVLQTNLANLYKKQNRLDDEIFWLREAEKNAPQSDIIHTALAVALRQAGRFEEAARHLDQAVRLAGTGNWDILIMLSQECALAGRFSEAIQFFRQALALRPDDPEIQLNLAAALLHSKRAAESLTAAEEVLHRHPDNDRAHFSRAQALLALDRANEAVSALENAVRLTPTKIEYQSALALALAAAGRAPEAVARLRKMIRQKPDSPHLLNNLAWLLVEKPDSPVYDPAAAVEAAARAAELSQRKDPRILHTLALAYAANGQSELARQVCEEAEPLARQAKLDDLAVDLRTLAETCQ